MKKFLSLVCCSLFMFIGCGQTSYYESTEISEEETKTQISEEMPETNTIYVQVSGAVINPGVYELNSNARVYEAISAAGGLKSDADDSDVNQAAFLEDGQKLYIYTAGEREMNESADSEADDGLININIASVQELTSLPGIGEAKASQIVSYRESNGDFSSIDELKNVSGIGDGIFNQISLLIKI